MQNSGPWILSAARPDRNRLLSPTRFVRYMSIRRPRTLPYSKFVSRLGTFFSDSPHSKINHLDYQVHNRRGGFDRAPCTQFGYPSQIITTEPRYSRGSSNMSYFVKGYKDGSIRLWDFRKVQLSFITLVMYRTNFPNSGFVGSYAENAMSTNGSSGSHSVCWIRCCGLWPACCDVSGSE